MKTNDPPVVACKRHASLFRALASGDPSALGELAALDEALVCRECHDELALSVRGLDETPTAAAARAAEAEPGHPTAEDLQQMQATQKPLNPDELVERIRGRLRALVHGRQIRVSVFRTREAPAVIEIAPLLFDRIVNSLLTYSAKCTMNGSILVELDGIPGFLTIKISYTGCGITDEDLERIFAAEFREAARLLSQIGGYAEVMSRPSIGTTFWIHLPQRAQIPRLDAVEDAITLRRISRPPPEGRPDNVVYVREWHGGRSADASSGEVLDDIMVHYVGTEKYRYRLRPSMSLIFDGKAIESCGIIGTGDSVEDAIDAFGRTLHRTIQHLRSVPPHLLSEDEQEQWRALNSLVDLPEFIRRHPIDEPVLGCVLDVLPLGLKLNLLTENCQVECSFDDLPPSAAAFKKGAWFEGRIRRFPDCIKWLFLQRRPRISEDDI